MKTVLIYIFGILLFTACQDELVNELNVEIYQTSRSGEYLKPQELSEKEPTIQIELFPNERFQEITGFGGAFTESSAYLLNQISPKNRTQILSSYFSENGANYSLTRTHMNSCDFSLDHYSYSSVPNDTLLKHFTIEPDSSDLIPMIKEAKSISKEGFKIIASPWTAPPWMKDNNDWYGGKLKPEFYASWSLFFSKYLTAYEDEGIDIWAITVENEPMGNDSHWESMHYTPNEMSSFVKNNLGPQLQKDGHNTKILVYDQNRGPELEEWASVLLQDEELSPFIYGTAVHWYSSTNNWFPNTLQYTHNLAKDKHILHTEGCVDSEVPRWKDNDWYWTKEATDWGYDWAKPENKHNHPKYVPVYRYARDIIGCLNNWVEGWVDWNMVLDEKGGPNLAQNWCVAPVLVDVTKDEVYYTPLYYVMVHFSKYIRPGATRIGFTNSDEELMVTATEKNGSYTVVVLNMSAEEKTFEIKLNDHKKTITIAKEALQTIVIQPTTENT